MSEWIGRDYKAVEAALVSLEPELVGDFAIGWCGAVPPGGHVALRGQGARSFLRWELRPARSYQTADAPPLRIYSLRLEVSTEYREPGAEAAAVAIAEAAISQLEQAEGLRVNSKLAQREQGVAFEDGFSIRAWVVAQVIGGAA